MKKVVIVGGGTAGWITAGTIAAKFLEAPSHSALEVILVESANVPTIGVGEGTWPTMRGTLSTMGIKETDFIRECDATFKQGAKFAKWVTGSNEDYYYHPLVLPQSYLHLNLANSWLESERRESFADSVSPQGEVCERSLAPKKITTPEYDGELNYAYHLNAGKFSSFIQNHCVTKLGVTHIYADMTDVNLDENGYVSSITTEQAGDIEGDLFIDCTGFKSLLLGEAMGVDFVSCQDTLFVDTALAVQCPYASEMDEIASHTISTAQKTGWIWDIGLSSRRGVGYVFSSAHSKRTEVEESFAEYISGIGGNIETLSVREIPIRSGHREKFWKKNVVAVGLSAGFLEPLEASAIVLVEMSARMIADQMPVNRSSMKIVSRRFNDVFDYRWQRIIDFLKLHYCLSKRDDSQFWLDNQNQETIPDSLKELLEIWKYQAPWQADFIHKDEVFPSASYQYVLYGMGFETHPSFHSSAEQQRKKHRSSMGVNKLKTEKLISSLPSHRKLISKIHKYGMSAI